MVATGGTQCIGCMLKHSSTQSLSGSSGETGIAPVAPEPTTPPTIWKNSTQIRREDRVRQYVATSRSMPTTSEGGWTPEMERNTDLFSPTTVYVDPDASPPNLGLDERAIPEVRREDRSRPGINPVLPPIARSLPERYRDRPTGFNQAEFDLQSVDNKQLTALELEWIVQEEAEAFYTSQNMTERYEQVDPVTDIFEVTRMVGRKYIANNFYLQGGRRDHQAPEHRVTYGDQCLYEGPGLCPNYNNPGTCAREHCRRIK